MKRIKAKRSRLTTISVLLGLSVTLALSIVLTRVPVVKAATFTVNTTSDGGTGSLRQAIIDANANPGVDIVTFNIPSSDPGCNALTLICTIRVSSALPNIVGPLTLDGTTQPGFSNRPLIDLTRRTSNVPGDGLTINAGNSTVRGFIIRGFGNRGIVLNNNGGDVISGNYIGTDAMGTIQFTNFLGGIQINTPNNTIGGTNGTTPGGACTGDCNVISGNTGSGLEITGSAATGNLVTGNFIGTNRTGTAAIRSNQSGIEINGAPTNTIGGTTPQGRNVISGHDGDGIAISGDGATGNIVEGNYIGTDTTGNMAVANQGGGVFVTASSNTIGGTTAGARNVISGNGLTGASFGIDGVNLANAAGSNGNRVLGNYIGTNAAATAALGNIGNGVRLGGPGNTVGGSIGTSFLGPCTGACNVISGNGANGVDIQGAAMNSVQGNYIGTNVSGTAAVGNTGDGVRLEFGAQGNTIGNPPVIGNLPVIEPSVNRVCLQDGINGNFIVFDTVTGEYEVTNCSNGTVVSRVGHIEFIDPFFELFDSGFGANVASYNPREQSGRARLFNVEFSNPDVTKNTCTCPKQIVAGNGGHGIDISDADNNDDPGNIIGSGINRTENLPNGAGGILNMRSFNSQLKDDFIRVAAGQSAIVNASGNGVTIQGNTFAGDVSNPINEASGANDNQNPPVLSNAIQVSTTGTQVTLDQTSAANTTYNLEVYVRSGGIARRVGTTTVTTDAGGHGQATLTVDPGHDYNYSTDRIMATATNMATGDTSPFSALIQATAAANTADLSFSMTGSPNPVGTGHNLTYSITATNNGPLAATNVVLSDVLPFSNVTFVSANASQGTCSQANGAVTCNIGTMNNGAVITASIVITPTAAGTIINDAAVVGAQIDSNRNNNSVSVTTTVLAGASVDGRVLTSDGRGLRNATVSITDSLGASRTATTSSFGFFSFTNVNTGQTYTFRVSSRFFRFQPRTMQIDGNLTLSDFVGLE